MQAFATETGLTITVCHYAPGTSKWNCIEHRLFSFISLTGRRLHETREPVADNECWKHFLERLLTLDSGSHIVDTLQENKPLVMSIFDDEFLSRFNWQEPPDS